MKHRVVKHEHHPDEGVYRLTYHRIEVHTWVEQRPNPNHPLHMARRKPHARIPAGIPLLIEKECSEERVIGQHDIVWSDGDPRWNGLSDEEIAAAQRQDLRDALAAREAPPPPPKTRSIGGEGTEL